jgi:hypothetical protein
VDLRDFVKRKAVDGWAITTEYVDRASGKTTGTAGIPAHVRGRRRKEVRCRVVLVARPFLA